VYGIEAYRDLLVSFWACHGPASTIMVVDFSSPERRHQQKQTGAKEEKQEPEQRQHDTPPSLVGRQRSGSEAHSLLNGLTFLRYPLSPFHAVSAITTVSEGYRYCCGHAPSHIGLSRHCHRIG
jgi:hypothetical protein